MKIEIWKLIWNLSIYSVTAVYWHQYKVFLSFNENLSQHDLSIIANSFNVHFLQGIFSFLFLRYSLKSWIPFINFFLMELVNFFPQKPFLILFEILELVIIGPLVSAVEICKDRFLSLVVRLSGQVISQHLLILTL